MTNPFNFFETTRGLNSLEAQQARQRENDRLRAELQVFMDSNAGLTSDVLSLRALNAELEKENRLMNQSIANCASDLLTASALNAELVAALQLNYSAVNTLENMAEHPTLTVVKQIEAAQDAARAALAALAKGETREAFLDRIREAEKKTDEWLAKAKEKP